MPTRQVPASSLSMATVPASLRREKRNGLPAGRRSRSSQKGFSYEGSGKVINTIPPNDFSFYEMLNDVVQQEPATSLDPELMGPLAAIGIIKGKPFAPDARMKKILTDALTVANATSRSLLLNPRATDWYLYPGSAWTNVLFLSGSEFETPIPMITPEASNPFHPRATAPWMRGRRSFTASPASRRRWRCACPVSARNASSSCWTRTRNTLMAPRPTR